MNENQRVIMASLARKRRIPKFPRALYPMAAERAYLRELLEMLRAIRREVGRQLVDRLPSLAADFYLLRPDLARQDNNDVPHHDAADDDLEIVINGIRVKVAEEFSDAQLARIAARAGMSVSDFNERVLLRGFKRVIGLDLWFAQPWLSQEISAFVKTNTALITSLRDGTLERVQSKVLNAFRVGMRHEVLAQQLMREISPEVGNVRASGQAHCPRSNLKAQWPVDHAPANRAWPPSLCLEDLADERVRPTDRAIEGQVFRWDTPPTTGHPSDEVNCRCIAEPFLEDLIGRGFETEAMRESPAYTIEGNEVDEA